MYDIDSGRRFLLILYNCIARRGRLRTEREGKNFGVPSLHTLRIGTVQVARDAHISGKWSCPHLSLLTPSSSVVLLIVWYLAGYHTDMGTSFESSFELEYQRTQQRK